MISDNKNVSYADDVKIDASSISSQKKMYDAIIIQTKFDWDNYIENSVVDINQQQFFLDCQEIIKKANSLLIDGGLLFIYGLPNYLSHLGVFLDSYELPKSNYLFKYWITCEFLNDLDSNNQLPSSHVGLLMYLKSKKTKTPTRFDINTKFVRVPYTTCPCCGKNTKDWGGKQHMLNPLGTALSDVWSFAEIPLSTTNEIPENLLQRIKALLGEGKNILVIKQTEKSYRIDKITNVQDATNSIQSKEIELDKVIHESCIDYLRELKKIRPEGTFDLAFADPPYNLAKDYSTYDDTLKDKEYISWCNEWLNGMYENLRPGGALLVLNIPKWSMYHFHFLSSKMIFKNWIVWDALSIPAGKLLPAHYSLLCFIKQGGSHSINLKNKEYRTSRVYCLRNSCIKSRVSEEVQQERTNDIWNDIYRIKHKKDRDNHPCQLPLKLMERIIDIFSKEGDTIFDPFGGAGTTAIAAKLLNRKFVITEIADEYVEIAKKNINKIALEDNGVLKYERSSVQVQVKNKVPKKTVEQAYISLCFEYRKIFSMDEIKELSSDVYELLSLYSGSFQKLQNLTKRKMEATFI